MEDSTLPGVGTSFKKWGCCKHTPFQEAQALATCKDLLKKQKTKIGSIQFFFLKRLAGAQIVCVPRPRSNRWSPPNRGEWLLAQRLRVAVDRVTYGHRPPLHGCSILHVASPFFSPSSPTFGYFGQLHLIGSNPCLPCPNLF
jgi:hypothetical protein